MARNGHPRVPRKIRGERNRRRREYENQVQAAYSMMAEGRTMYRRTGRRTAVGSYAPMLEASLKGPLELPTPMSKRG